MNAAVPEPAPSGTRELAKERDAFLSFLGAQRDADIGHALSDRTRTLYDGDFRVYERWCQTIGIAPLPADPDMLSRYIAHMAMPGPDGQVRYKVATIERALSAIARINYEAGYEKSITRHPLVSQTLAGIRRRLGTRPDRKQALRADDVLRIQEEMGPSTHTTWPSGVFAARDTFAVLCGYVTAMRRAEVAALDVGNIAWHRGGITLFLPFSKGDQEGEGAMLEGPFLEEPWLCMPCSWLRWSAFLVAETGPDVDPHLGTRRTRLMRATFTDPPAYIERLTEWVDTVEDPLRRERVRLNKTLAGRDTDEDLALERYQEKIWPLVADYHLCDGPGSPEPDLAAVDPASPAVRAISKAGVVSDRGISGSGLNEMLKRRLGFKPDPDNYGFHSLRSGFVTDARAAGVDNKSIRDVTRHGSDRMIEVYDRDNRSFKATAAARKVQGRARPHR